MKHDLMLSATLSCFVLARSLAAQVPQMKTVQPNAARIGDVLRVHGAYLGKAQVEEVYLSDRTFDIMVKVLDQKEDGIEFRIPPFVKPGRLQLVMKTAGKHPLILEQPLYITVEAPAEQHQAIKTLTPPDAPAKQPSMPLLAVTNRSLSVDRIAKPTSSDGPPQQHSSGRLIWTGALKKNALLSFSPEGASSGILNGRLPGHPVKIVLHPAELVDGGIAIYSRDRLRSDMNEPASAWNEWNVEVRNWDPIRIANANVIEAPGPTNDWKRLVLRNGSRNVSVLVVEWQSEASQ